MKREEKMQGRESKQISLEQERKTTPYLYKSGQFTIELKFAGTETLESCVAEYLSKRYGVT